MRALLAVALVVVLAGCAAPVADQQPADGVGEVEGITAESAIDVTLEDGIDEAELKRLVYRTMARIEEVRGLAFDDPVTVERLSREEFVESRPAFGTPDPTWDNLRWQTLFVIGADRNASEVRDGMFETAVQGYYSPSEERIVIVGDPAGIDKRTLIHELVHALQDQQFGLVSTAATWDETLARDSVIEGEAELVPDRYLDRCGVIWDCIVPADGSDTRPTSAVDTGLLLTLQTPYQQGPAFVDDILDRGGWRAVDDLHDRFPASSEQVIHPDRYPDVRPANVTVPDRSTAAWERFEDGRQHETLGEASIYAMLVHNQAVSVEDPFVYDHPFSDGWAGDSLVPYRQTDASGTGVDSASDNDHGDTAADNASRTGAAELGYVWETDWESQQDADQFEHALMSILLYHGALDSGEDSHVISDGPFAGAYRVTSAESTVRIVSGPTVESLSAIHEPPS